MHTNKTKRLVITGILLAMATVLSLIRLFSLPWGGSITPFSMLPIMLIGYFYGTKYGLLSAFVYSLLQIVLGATASQAFAGLSGISVLYMVILDYTVAFSVLGFTGLFSKIRNNTVGFTAAVIVTGLMRYATHTVSGIILWSEYASGFFENTGGNSFAHFFPALSNGILANCSGLSLFTVYSVIYNGLYMIPEIIICAIGAAVIINIKPVHDLADNT